MDTKANGNRLLGSLRKQIPALAHSRISFTLALEQSSIMTLELSVDHLSR